MKGLVKNTLMFRFPDGVPGPSVVEMARFAKAFDADKFTMESVYKISEERCICIKFMNERTMKDALMQNHEDHVFEYSNGEKVKIKMSVAGGCSKYIRIFDLPPEVPDQEISTVLSRYGVVRRMVREKYPAQLELDLTTGVRGIYIEIKKEIPATLFFLNRRGRIYYEGVKHKCFLCKEEGHLKADCPRNSANKQKGQSADTNNGSVSATFGDAPNTSGRFSYAAMLKSRTPVAEVSDSSMTVLVPAAKATEDIVKEHLSSDAADDVVRDTQPTDVEVAGNDRDDQSLESDSATVLDVEMDEHGQAVKRQHESSSTEDEGFNRITRSRKQKKDDDALEMIASATTRLKGSGKSKTKC